MQNELDKLFEKIENKIEEILEVLKKNNCDCCKKTKALPRDKICFEGED